MRPTSLLLALLLLLPASACRTARPAPAPPAGQPSAPAPAPPTPPPTTEAQPEPAPTQPGPAKPEPQQPPPEPPRRAPPRLTEVRPYVPPAAAPSDAAVLQRSGLAPGRVAFLLFDPVKGEAVAEHAADTAHAPASTAKVLTALAALDVLGPAHAFTTQLLVRGAVKGGVLRGDVVLRGEGDPQLSYAQLAALAHALRRAGVTRITGRFLYDDTRLAAVPTIDPEQAEDASYSPGLSALAPESNRIALRWRPVPGAPGAVEAYAVPSLPGGPELGLYPGADDGVSLHRVPGEGDAGWLLSANLPATGVRNLPLRAPGAWAARVLRQLAAQQGVALPEPVPGVARAGARVLASERSRPVTQLAEGALLPSNNPMAELLLLTTARKLGGRPRGLDASAKAVEAWWRRTLPRVDWDGFALKNGSGLSVHSRVTPRQMVAALAHGRRRARVHGRPFFTLLPASGWSGTLAGRLYTPEAVLRVWAKTGSMDYATALTGHLFTRSGRELLFCILVSDLPQREAARARPVGSLAEAEARDGAADAWMARARGVQDALLTRWVQVH